MFDVDDIRSCIQEWFADASGCVEVAKTYAAIMIETERQLEYMMEERGSEE